ncbi:MAG: HEPN domain-containing protein [Candidatus Cloacimonetes bacterium]|nr:HEPN domain-containing protein [Candidatus Cloacimonadota bacterium]
MENNAKQKLIANWKIKPDNDIEIVKIGLASNKIISDVLCFHCQQCVEKYLKLFLIYHNIDFPKTHNISIILEECKKIDSNFTVLQDIVYLTEYAVEIRYPDDFYIPDLEETQKAYNNALKVKDFISRKLKYFFKKFGGF